MRRPNFESEFKAEYNRLNSLDARHVVARAPKGEAQRWTPAKLNRYGNILPYDRNRVILKDVDVEGVMENCDYINASWMRKVEMKIIQFIIIIGTKYGETFAGDSDKVEKGSILRRKDPPRRHASNSGR